MAVHHQWRSRWSARQQGEYPRRGVVRRGGVQVPRSPPAGPAPGAAGADGARRRRRRAIPDAEPGDGAAEAGGATRRRAQGADTARGDQTLEIGPGPAPERQASPIGPQAGPGSTRRRRLNDVGLVLRGCRVRGCRVAAGRRSRRRRRAQSRGCSCWRGRGGIRWRPRSRWRWHAAPPARAGPR
jgi:hypothetical protein